MDATQSVATDPTVAATPVASRALDESEVTGAVHRADSATPGGSETGEELRGDTHSALDVSTLRHRSSAEHSSPVDDLAFESTAAADSATTSDAVDPLAAAVVDDRAGLLLESGDSAREPRLEQPPGVRGEAVPAQHSAATELVVDELGPDGKEKVAPEGVEPADGALALSRLLDDEVPNRSLRSMVDVTCAKAVAAEAEAAEAEAAETEAAEAEAAEAVAAEALTPEAAGGVEARFVIDDSAYAFDDADLGLDECRDEEVVREDPMERAAAETVSDTRAANAEDGPAPGEPTDDGLLDAELAGFRLEPGEFAAVPAPIEGIDALAEEVRSPGLIEAPEPTPLVAQAPGEALANGEADLQDFLARSQSQLHVLAMLDTVARRVRAGEIVPSVDAGASPEAVLASVLTSILSPRK